MRNARKLVSEPKEDFAELMLPEGQRRKLNAEVREIAALMGIEERFAGRFAGGVYLAEDLALRQIEQEKKLPLKRHVQYRRSGIRRRIYQPRHFDAGRSHVSGHVEHLAEKNRRGFEQSRDGQTKFCPH